jgi:hypothetical protein
MAINLRGTPTTGSAINGGNITLSLPTGRVAGDVVVVFYATNAVSGGGTSSSGWTQIGSNLGATTRIQVFRKVMGASPDANIVLVGTTAAADSSSAIAIAFSGVNNATPEDAAVPQGATGSSTNPDPAAITPITTGAVAIAYAATSVVDTTGTSGPTGYSNFTQVSSSDTNSTTSYLAWKGALAGGVSENPSAFTGVSTAAWAAYSVVLKPDLSMPDQSVGPNIPAAFMKRAALTAAVLATTGVAWAPPPPAPAPPLFDLSIGPNIPSAYLVRVLSTAARDTTSGYEWAPQVPAAAAAEQNYGFHNERHVYSPAKRSQDLLTGWDWSPQTPPPAPAYTDLVWGWFQGTPTKAQLTTAVRDTSWWPSMPPRVPETEYQEGWRSRFGEPPVMSRARRSVALLGDAAIFAERIPDREFQEGWRSRYSDPPTRAQLTTALRDSGWQPYMPPREPEAQFQDGWRHRWTDPPAHLQRQRSVHLLGQVVWPAQVANVEYQEGWRQEFSRPTRLSQQPRQEGFVAWPGIGYSVVVTQTPSELWWGPWQDPPARLRPQPRLEGATSWSVGTVLYQPVGTPSELWWGPWQGPPAQLQARRSIELRTGGSIAWNAQVPNVEYQEGWRSQFPTPPVFGQPRRATNLIESWPWPGYGYSFAAITQTPSDLWFWPWQGPPVQLQARRSVGLLGYTVTARVPEVEYQEGWRSAFQQPARVWQQPRQQGFVSFAGVQGLPITLAPGAWSTIPASLFTQGWRRATSWPWQAYQFTAAAATPSIWWHTQWRDPATLARPRARAIDTRGFNWQPTPIVAQTATPSIFWRHVWTDPPKARARSAALLTGAWGQWEPQEITAVTPPQCGSVTFHFAPVSSISIRPQGSGSVRTSVRGQGSVRGRKRDACDPDEEP